MFDAEKPDIAIIATPPLTHPELCLLALEHGCHVFCEKPFMPSVEDADRVIQAAVRQNRVLSVNNQYYQMPIFRAAKERIDRGDAGKLYFIEVHQRMHLVPAEEGGWKAALQDQRVLYEFGTHALDLVCQYFGAYPVSLSARTSHGDALVVLRLDFPDERVAQITLNRVSRAPTKYLDVRLECERASLNASLGGVAAMGVSWDAPRRRPRLRFSLTDGGEARWECDGRSHTFARQRAAAFHEAAAAHFQEFLKAIRAGAMPATHAREVLKLVFAAYRSAQQGGSLVPIP
jgi:predicted dehydrogenase